MSIRSSVRSALPARTARLVRRRRARLALATATAAILLAGVAASPALAGTSHSAAPTNPAKPTIVLVHGAWADSSSWDAVVTRLLRSGYPVDAFATPLQSLSGDARALRTFLDSISGPIVLVGHSYGGAVITNAATGDAQVKALVYVDAFAPDQGQLVLNLASSASVLNEPGVLQPVPLAALTPTSELYVAQSAFPGAFANDLSPAKGRLLAATQRPVTYGALTEASGVPAWRTIPSWFEVGTIDQVIPPAAQLAMAQLAGAHITEVRSGHLPMISVPARVTALIQRAARATS
jgi:pimeloyl-ACP methyl ester carboxylesterase